MGRQNITGNLTEGLVKNKLVSLGFDIYAPIPDRGVDFIVTSKNCPDKKLRIQVKGRGKQQKNRRYRWFQIRTTKNQREETIEEGLPVSEAWRKKVSLSDIFIFVSERQSEFWIFTPSEIEEIVRINRFKYGNRKDNKDGMQTELDLDVNYGGKPLTEIFSSSLNKWSLIAEFFTND